MIQSGWHVLPRAALPDKPNFFSSKPMLFGYGCSCEGRAREQYRLGTGAGEDGLGLLLGEALLDRLGSVDDACLSHPDVHQAGCPGCLCLACHAHRQSMRQRRETGTGS